MSKKQIKKTLLTFSIILLVCLGIGATIRPKPHVNPVACLGCSDCVRICPVKGQAIHLVRGKAIINLDMCIGCGKCVFICSNGAVR